MKKINIKKKDTQEKGCNNPFIGYGIRAGIILTGIIYLIFGFPNYEPLPQATSLSGSYLLNQFGIHATSFGHHIIVSFPTVDRIYELSSECSGLILYSMFVLGIFIVPSFSLKHRIISLCFIPFLFLGNTLRIVMGILIGYQFDAEASIFFHDTFGQIIIFFWVIICFIIWLKITNNFPLEYKKEVN
jgi:exosortase/archaeosortase family protein